MFKSFCFAVISSVMMISCGGPSVDTTSTTTNSNNGNNGGGTIPIPSGGYNGCLIINKKGDPYCLYCSTGKGYVGTDKITFNGTYYDESTKFLTPLPIVSVVSYANNVFTVDSFNVGPNYAVKKFSINTLNVSGDSFFTELPFDDPNLSGAALAINSQDNAVINQWGYYTADGQPISNMIVLQKNMFYMILFDKEQKPHFLKCSAVWDSVGSQILAADATTSITATVQNARYGIGYEIDGTIKVDGTDVKISFSYQTN